MIGLTISELFNSIFNITVESIKFELFIASNLVNRDDSLYETVKNFVKEKLGNADIAQDLLGDETIEPIIIEEHIKTYQEKNCAKPLIKLIHRYQILIFQDFESFLRTEVDLVEDDIRLNLDENNSSFITYENTPGNHTFKDVSEVLFNILQPEYPGFSNVIASELDDFTMKINCL